MKHPDFISVRVLPRGRNLVIHDNDGMHLIDLNLVVEVNVPGIAEPTHAQDQRSWNEHPSFVLRSPRIRLHINPESPPAPLA